MSDNTPKASSKPTGQKPLIIDIKLDLIYQGIRYQASLLQLNGGNENIRKDVIYGLYRYAFQLELLEKFYRMDVSRNFPDFKVTIEQVTRGLI